MSVLSLRDAPRDPVDRLVWLADAQAQVADELRDAFAEAYFTARLQGLFQAALDLKIHGRKTALAFTRHENERRGRAVRWGDL